MREQVDRVTNECTEAIAAVIAADTDLPEPAALLLAVSLVGMAQVSSRFWLDSRRRMNKDEAATFVGNLAWRGIAGYPKTDEH